MSHTKESLMSQAQCFASAWSLVGGPFDSGYGLDDAEQAKSELAEMVGEIIQQRDELLEVLKYAACALGTDGHDPIVDAAIAKADAAK